MEKKTFTAQIGGRDMIIETGHVAGQANGAVTVRYGDTVILATATMSKKLREGMDFFPLLVDYEERLYAAGKIKGSRFIKREGRASDDAILTARMVDRSIRPLFDHTMRNDVQVVITVLSWDGENDADILALVGASAALRISNIPWGGPIAAVRVGRIDGEWVLNPTYSAREKSDLDIILAAHHEEHVMIEGAGNEVDEKSFLDGLAFAHKHVRETLDLIEKVAAAVGQPKLAMDTNKLSAEEQAAKDKLQQKVLAFASGKLRTIWKMKDKMEREAAITKLTEELGQTLKEDTDVMAEQRLDAKHLLEQHLDEEARKLVLEEGIRVDGRKLDEVRPLSAAVSLVPRTHGSGLFQRGETQVLSLVTLGSPGDEQTQDTMELSGTKRYMHHYNFPGFSVGDVQPIRGAGRREIGHGALAEKAMLPVLPNKEEFPYTIRVVSEVLSSNGSTSQASICGSTLSLMDAGVPIKAPVAGIAMGLISSDDKKTYKVLTDIQGIEDHAGDMDYKVAGTTKGITAVQMDIKLGGIPMSVSAEALAGAKTARLKILEVMAKAIPEPRKELSPYAPRIITIKIDPEQIRAVIGKGGETINKIIDECGGVDVMKIDIEQDGMVYITSTDAAMADKAKTWIADLTREIKVGEIFDGTVIDIIKDRMRGNEIGAIVQLTPGKDGMVHVSNISVNHVANVSDVLHVGDKVKVKVMEVDKERGKISLSMKALDPNYSPDMERPRGGFNDRGPRGGGGGFRGGPRGGGRGAPHRGFDRNRGFDRPSGPPNGGGGQPGDFGVL
jgi:polyribonucleotide nucleotidyltransferase